MQWRLKSCFKVKAYDLSCTRWKNVYITPNGSVSYGCQSSFLTLDMPNLPGKTLIACIGRVVSGKILKINSTCLALEKISVWLAGSLACPEVQLRQPALVINLLLLGICHLAFLIMGFAPFCVFVFFLLKRVVLCYFLLHSKFVNQPLLLLSVWVFCTRIKQSKPLKIGKEEHTNVKPQKLAGVL